jgi:hypothetical protein
LSSLLVSAHTAELQLDVRFGSKADIQRSLTDVRFTPNSRQQKPRRDAEVLSFKKAEAIKRLR